MTFRIIYRTAHGLPYQTRSVTAEDLPRAIQALGEPVWGIRSVTIQCEAITRELERCTAHGPDRYCHIHRNWGKFLPVA